MSFLNQVLATAKFHASANSSSNESGDSKIVVDYILIRKAERKWIRNVNVIPGEA